MLQVKATNTREKDGHCLASGGGGVEEPAFIYY